MKYTNSSQKILHNRRKLTRENDRFFQCMIFINVLGWFVFIGALIVFYHARPEFVSGVQAFWGIEGRQEWSETLTVYLFGLLLLCIVISASVLCMKRKRNRREKDYFGINGYVLMFIATLSLIILYFEFKTS